MELPPGDGSTGRFGAACRCLVPLALAVAVMIGAAPNAAANEPCPPLTDFVKEVPLPPRVGTAGSVTPASRTDSAIVPAAVPFIGMYTRVNLTIDASSVDFDVVPSVTYAFSRVSGFNLNEAAIVKCDDTPFVGGTVTGTKGLWSTTIERTVMIGDPPWNPPNFYLFVGGNTFANWRADITPCYLPEEVATC